jgi:ubiquinone biosynthesis protein UbiJ
MMENNLIAAMNWAIEKDEPLHAVLKTLAGKHIRVGLPWGGSHLDWSIQADGLLNQIGLNRAAEDTTPNVLIHIGTDLTRGMRIEGDAAVAEKLGPLADLIKKRISPWERFWENSPMAILARQAVDYAKYESNVIISKEQAQAHDQVLRQFRDALDRFEKRLDQFERTKSL